MKRSGTVLVVDDDAYVRESLVSFLERTFEVRTAASVDEALTPERLTGADIVVTDLRMPGRGGRELVETLAASEPGLPVVVLTAYGTVTSAIECMRVGAADYLLKPTDPDELHLVLTRALERARSQRELGYLRATEPPRGEGREPLGVSLAWRQVMDLAAMAAPVDTSVLLIGESGTGKEEVARYVHSRSPRASGPFVCVNCAAIPSELFESEFFGHRRGSFTGALEDREGRFRIADQGTLFLDEVNSLPAPAQAKVLRVLQDGKFQRVGESHSTQTDVRVICASNADLAGEVQRGAFRSDLFYRINVLTIELPPLHERPEDVSVLAGAFLEELGGKLGKRLDGISPEASAALLRYPWPGNVRELRNVLERGIIVARGRTLGVEDLPFRRRAGSRGEAAGPDLDLRRILHETERGVLETALRRAGGVRRDAARLLGIDERNVAYYLRKHDLMDFEP
jgi:DNA-binding NtrC family response regulator